MTENNSLAGIERLPRHEFDLDVEEQKQLQTQCEVEVQKVSQCSAASRQDGLFRLWINVWMICIMTVKCLT